MADKKITLRNDTLFEFAPDVLFYKVVKGTVYLFAIEKLKNGLDSARTEISTFKEGDFILSIPTVRQETGIVRFVLTGSLNSQIEKAEFESVGNEKTGFAKLEKALLAVTNIIHTEYNEKLDFSNIFESADKEKSVREYAVQLSEQLCKARSKKIANESLYFSRRMQSTQKAFSAALEEIASTATGNKTQLHYLQTNDNPVFKAAFLVAKYDDIEFKTIIGKNYNTKNALHELAKDNNIRIRPVTLRNNWWKKDNGALLAWYIINADEENFQAEPCALIPEKSGGYVCILTSGNKSEPVTDENASKINVTAYMLYKPMASKRISLKALFKFVFWSKKVFSDFGFFILLGFVSAIVSLFIPELTRVFMDSIIPQAARNMAVQISFLVLVCMLSASVFDFIKALVISRMETKSDFKLQSALMDRLLKLPVGFFKSYTAGELAQKLLSVIQIRQLLFGTLLSSSMTFLFAFVYLFQLFRYSSYMLRWCVLFSLLSIAVTVVTSLSSLKWNKKEIETRNKISGMLYQFIVGVNKLVMTFSEKRSFSVWAKLFSKQNECMYRVNGLRMISGVFSTCIPLVVTLSFYGIYMTAVAKGKIDSMTTGKFLAFLTSYTMFQNALLSAITALTGSVDILPLYSQAKTILDATPEIQESKPAVSSLSGNIEISHVSFRYSPDTQLILKDVSMKIEKGEFVAIVGGSGSGKSTLMRVLLGFEKPETGTVFFDNHDISSIDIGSVRRNMGVVLQNSTVMQDSIYANITGSSALTIDDAWEAAEMAGLADDIHAMPMGMHTLVTEGGGTLSGGQRQRLIIARAIARKPNILIFDEATSALDNRTQAQVSASLESLNVTRIVIAHRLSTIINADRIYVLNNGVIEECGTYSELINKGGYFAELAKRQQA